MIRDKEVGSAIIFFVNSQYSFLVELRVLTVMFVRKRLVKKRLLLLMQNAKWDEGKQMLATSFLSKTTS